MKKLSVNYTADYVRKQQEEEIKEEQRRLWKGNDG
jgi:hypothetical protein